MSECTIIHVPKDEVNQVSEISRRLDLLDDKTKMVIMLGKGMKMPKHHDACLHIDSDDVIPAFLKAKTEIDAANIRNIKILTTDRTCGVFRELCLLLLTSIYKWEVESVIHGTSHNLSADEVRESVQKHIMNEPRDDIEILRAPLIPSDIFCYGFSTRTGGVTKAKGMSSLNLVYSSKKPDPELFVLENQRRLAEKAGFGPETIHLPQCVHGKGVHVIGREPPEHGYDGLITNRSGITLMAPGADCTTIIMADPVRLACAAIHGGWKGALEKVAPVAVEAMITEFGCDVKDILVVFGPSIGKCCLEFSLNDANRFKAIGEDCIIWREGHPKPYVDLHRAHRIMLEAVGILPEHIDDTTLTMCTLCNPDKFFSYRRDKIPFGNQVGFITLK